MILAAADLHMHSCLSPCGDEDMTPCNIAGMAYLNGLKIAALTDHNSSDNCPAFYEACRGYGIVPVAGMELTTAEDVHMVCLFPTLEKAMAFSDRVKEVRMKIPNRPEIFGRQLILNSRDEIIGEDPYFLPAAVQWGLETAAKQVRESGGVCYPAHIDREANGLLAMLGSFPEEPVFTLAELHDGSKKELLGGRRLLVASDAHYLSDISDGSFTLKLNEGDGSEEDLRRGLFSWLEGKE